MGINVPPLKDDKGKHKIEIELTGPVDEACAKELSEALNKVLDAYRPKMGPVRPEQKRSK
jgi:hypothetical protein